jgi:hypothetical protein
VPRAYEEKGAYGNQKMREKGLTKFKMKAIDPQNFFAPQKVLKVPRAYESLNPGLGFHVDNFSTGEKNQMAVHHWSDPHSLRQSRRPW